MLLSACETGNVKIADTSEDFSKPVLVASPMSIDTVPFASAQRPEGGKVTRKDISGYLLMPVGTYLKYETDMKRAAEAVTRAMTEVEKTNTKNMVFDVYARTCKEDAVCDSIAAARVDAKLKPAR